MAFMLVFLLLRSSTGILFMAEHTREITKKVVEAIIG